MMERLTLSLEITLVGMGLVFAAILLLWAVMVLLVRLTAGRDEKDQERDSAEIENDELAIKQQAAAAAVSIALAHAADESVPHEFPLPATALVSPWQGVMRTKMLNKRGNVR